MKIFANRSDRENFIFLIGLIIIIIGILALLLAYVFFPIHPSLALLLAYVFFPIHPSEVNIGQTAVPQLLIWKISPITY